MTAPATGFAAEREAMVERQLRRRGISGPRILEAFRSVPREAFVAAEHAHVAYGDHPIAIAAGQTVSQPYIVALMIDAADISRDSRVLEVGSGSGYAAAVISRIACQVIGVERQPALIGSSRDRLRRLGYTNIEIVAGDGSVGWLDGAPYDAILVSASGSHVPDAIIEQLAPGGQIVMPIGAVDAIQRLIKVTRCSDGRIERSDLGAVRFVPLIGEEGWKAG